ncbi:MAG: protein kinase domain-containing protein, partial [Candidatus Rifleibacteriota bacterium]
VFTMLDINDNRNIVGEGINNTQRVMDFGDAGHILCSKRLAEEILAARPACAAVLHDAGIFADKHGLQHHIFNIFDWEIGNPATPTRNRLDKDAPVKTHFWKQLLDLAIEEASFLKHRQVSASHLFLALTKMAGSLTADKIKSMGHDPTIIRRGLRQQLGKENHQTAPEFSPEVQIDLKTAWNQASEQGRDIEETDLLKAIFHGSEGKKLKSMLEKVGLASNFFSDLIETSQPDQFASVIDRKIEVPVSIAEVRAPARNEFVSDPGNAGPAAVTQPIELPAAGIKVALHVENGPQKGRVFNFNEPELFLVGRSPDANFVLDQSDGSISRRHFMIEVAPPRCYLRDFASTNGTYVNNQKCQISELHDGDQITAGKTSFRVKISCTTANLASCRRCGERFHSKGHSDVVDCPACIAELELEQQNRMARTKVPVAAACDQCGCNLSQMAGNDGLGITLSRTAAYRCPACIEKLLQHKNTVEFGRFRLLQQLGQGGMGTVFLCWDPDTARLSALKRILLPDKDPRAARRFLREMQIMQTLDHPHLVKIYQDGVEDDTPFFLAEYLNAGSLSALIEKNGRIATEKALDIASQVLDGLAYFHASGHIHRDMKPSNILLNFDSKNQKVTAKIADFGLARSYVNLGGTRLTRPGEFAGSLYFTAPEQIVNFAKVTPAADIFSVGATLYQMLSGLLPYQIKSSSRSFQDSLLTVLEEPVVPLAQRDPGIDRELAAIVDRALARKPQDRFASAEDFKYAIERMAGPRP